MEINRRRHILLAAAYFLLAAFTLFAAYTLVTPISTQRTFGAVYVTLNTLYYETLNDELRAAVEQQGDRLLSRAPEDSVELQEEQIYDLLRRGVDGLFVAVQDDPAIDEAIRVARGTGIPVIAVDIPRSDPDTVDSTVISDNYELGAMCAESLMQHCDDASVLVLTQSRLNMQERARGFLETLTGAYEVTDVLTCDHSLDQTHDQTLAALDSGKQFDAVFAVDDSIALSAMSALALRGQAEDVLVYGVNGSPESKILINQSLMDGTAAQHPGEIAKCAVKHMYDCLDGKAVVSEEQIPGIMITEDNIDQFSLTDWQ